MSRFATDRKKGAITIICKLFALASCSTDYILSLCYICSFMSLVIYFFLLLASCGIARIYSMYNLRMVKTYPNSFDALYTKDCNITKKKIKVQPSCINTRCSSDSRLLAPKSPPSVTFFIEVTMPRLPPQETSAKSIHRHALSTPPHLLYMIDGL